MFVDNYSSSRSLQSFFAEVRLQISIGCGDFMVGVCMRFSDHDDGVYLPIYIGKKGTPCIPFALKVNLYNR